MARIYWELEGVVKGCKGNECLASGTKSLCKRIFKGLTEERKKRYELISLQPYNDEERLDFDETLYTDFE
jgi:hypothetical protein